MFLCSFIWRTVYNTCLLCKKNFYALIINGFTLLFVRPATLFNPRFTKLFSVARLTKGVVISIPRELENRYPEDTSDWYHSIAMGLFYPYIPK